MTGKGRNARALISILKDRTHNIGAEIGVFEGDTSKRLLQALPSIALLICVDVWEFNKDFAEATPNKKGRIFNANWHKTRRAFKKNVLDAFPYRVSDLPLTSRMASELVQDGSLDFVFIDATHTYEHAKEDIKLWVPKVKIGGLISGDDFVDKPGYGVKKAVRESFDTFSVIFGRIWYTTKVEGI